MDSLPEGYKPERKRVHSINSLLKDQIYNSKQDTHSFKRISKLSSWLFNPWNNEEYSSPVKTKDSSSLELNDTASSPLLKDDDLKYVFKDRGWKVRDKLVKDRETFEVKEDKRCPQTNGNREVYKTRVAPGADTKLVKSYQTQLARHNLAKHNLAPQNLTQDRLARFKALSSDVLSAQRIVIIKNLPANSTASGLLTRICGGPLERIVYHENRELASLEIYFIYPKDAQRFFNYGQTGLFIYNGSRMTLEWANETNTEDINLVHPKIHKPLMAQIAYGARRSLLFVKEIQKHIHHNNKLHYPDPESNYSKDFDVKLILRDFSSLGNVVDICPIISRKLSFCIHFDDIRTAIAIKKQCEQRGTKLNVKYKDWDIHYGKDITDKPCLQP